MLSINRKSLQNALKVLVKVADAKSINPACAMIRVRAQGLECRLTATDLRQTLIATLALDTESDLDVLLNARDLNSLIKGKYAKDEQVLFAAEPGNKVSLLIGDASVSLASAPGEEFPRYLDLGMLPLADFAAATLADALAYVVKAVSTDDSRHHLSGVYFEQDKVIATDGHRMHVAPSGATVERSMIVQRNAIKTLGLICKSSETVVCERNDTDACFTAGAYRLIVRLVDAQFPPYRQVIPSNVEFKLTVGLGDFRTALDHVSRVANIKNSGIVAKVNGKLTLSTENSDTSATAEMDVQCSANTHEGPDFAQGLNARYLIEALADVAAVDLSFAGSALDPLRIDLDGGKLAIVMPMRI